MLEKTVSPQDKSARAELRQPESRQPESRHIHLVGVSGTGMSAIAWVLLGSGYTVSGSDLQHNDLTAALETAGLRFYLGHAGLNVTGADTVVISSAIPSTNPERLAALAAGVPVLKRAQFLGQLMANRFGIAVAGTHGKTTTTGMIAEILIRAGTDPSVIVGGVLPSLEKNGRAGNGAPFLIEADEYDRMFLGLHPRMAVITNIEHDHPDLFTTEAEYKDAFCQFVALLPSDGTLVCCVEDAGVRELLSTLPQGIEVIGYGLTTGQDGSSELYYRADQLRPNQLGGLDFLVNKGPEMLGLLRLRVPGEHNVGNALAATAVAVAMDIPFAVVREALAAFGGINRRFELVGEVADVLIIDDYAHHPTEVRVTLAAARQQFPGRRIWAVWQPHTFSRTQMLSDEFASAFDDADRVIALDIYRSREQFTAEINSSIVVEKMKHPYARHIGPKEEAAAYVLDRVRPGDVIMTLGAGDGDMVGRWILDGLQDSVNAHNR